MQLVPSVTFQGKPFCHSSLIFSYCFFDLLQWRVFISVVWVTLIDACWCWRWTQGIVWNIFCSLKCFLIYRKQRFSLFELYFISADYSSALSNILVIFTAKPNQS